MAAGNAAATFCIDWPHSILVDDFDASDDAGQRNKSLRSMESGLTVTTVHFVIK